MLLRRVGFLATLATGMLLRGMACHGMTSDVGDGLAPARERGVAEMFMDLHVGSPLGRWMSTSHSRSGTGTRMTAARCGSPGTTQLTRLDASSLAMRSRRS